ncbi:MAG: hypothetical protein AAF916_13120, partial [Planctomycetota bacterium]
TGCGTAADTATATHGSHGGHLMSMPAGAGFVVELTVDESRREMVLYTEDAESSRPHPLPVKTLSARFKAGESATEANFMAKSRHDDPSGHASRFVFPLDELSQQLLNSKHFAVEVTYTASGKTFTASLRHSNDHAHDYRHD